MATAEEERLAYQATLDKLTFNSRPFIMTLTELAHESSQPGAIVQCIMDRIQKVSADKKMPALYLMDSIVKNHGLRYKSLFEPRLVDAFSVVFASNEDVKIRTALYKLRCTWNEVFTAQTLYWLDARVKKSYDPKWPIANPTLGQEASATATQIHINPNYFHHRTQGPSAPTTTVDREFEAKLKLKEQELKRIRMKRMELEIEQERQRLAAQAQALPGSGSVSPSLLAPAVQTPVPVEEPASSSQPSGETKRQKDPRLKNKPVKEPSPVRPTPPPPQIRHDFKGTASPLKPTRKEKDTKKDSKRGSSTHRKPDQPSPKKSKLSPTRSLSPSSSPLDGDEQKKFRIPKKNSSKKRSPSPKSFKEEGPFTEFNKGRRPEAGSKASKRRGSNQPKNPPKDKKIKVNNEIFGDEASGLKNSTAGWAKFKESNPDEFRTPLRDSERELPPGGGVAERRFNGGRAAFRGRGGQRQRGDRFPSGGPAGGGPMPFLGNGPFPGLAPGPGGNGNVPFGMHDGSMPNLDYVLHSAEPRTVETEIIPSIITQAKDSLEQGCLSQDQFSHLMRQVVSLKEAAMMAQADKRHQQREDKENNLASNLPGPWVGGFGAPPMGGTMPGMMSNGLPGGGGMCHRDLPFASEDELKAIEADPYKTLPIDGLSREIRFYGETATVVMSDNDMRDLSFNGEEGHRRVIVDQGLVTVSLKLDVKDYSDIILDGIQHKIKLGAPTRELWIDGQGYECYFDKAISVKVGPKVHEFFLEGPPPRVKIGESPRVDLCAGHVQLVINGDLTNSVRLFLDPKPQRVDILGKPHVLRFVEGLCTLLINEHPFRTEFGGVPMVIYVNGQRQYLRLTSLPKGVKLGSVRVIGLVPQEQIDQFEANHSLHPAPPSPPSNSNGALDRFDSEGVSLAFDKLLLPLFPDSKSGGKRDMDTMSESSYKCDKDPGTADPSPNASQPPTPSPSVNVHDLWSQLLKAGFVSTGADAKEGSAPSGIPGLDTPKAPENAKRKPYSSDSNKSSKGRRRGDRKEVERKVASIRKITFKSHHSSLKERQQGLVNLLYDPAALQCKNCGLRFSPGDMISYSQHLDWHFRMNRREKDNARKAQSRKWFFERMDWIISDELEVAEDRDMTEAEQRGSANASPEPDKIPTVPVSDDAIKPEGEGTCSICQEEFDQFFKEGTDDDDDGKWHYRNAIRVEGDGIFHPQCHADKSVNESAYLMEEEESEPQKDERPQPMEEGDKAVKEEPKDVEMEDSIEIKAESEQKAEDQTTLETVGEVETEPDENGPSEESPAPVEAAEIKSEPLPIGEVESENQPEELAKDVATESEVVNDVETVAEAETNPLQEEDPENGADTIKTELNPDSSDVEAKTEVVEEEPVTPQETTLEAPVQVTSEAVVSKTGIRINITSQVELERRESVISSQSEKDAVEDSDFDPDGIKQEAKIDIDARKPKLKDRKFTELPVQNRGKELSSLCSIM